jgi:hypothetical protein
VSEPPPTHRSPKGVCYWRVPGAWLSWHGEHGQVYRCEPGELPGPPVEIISGRLTAEAAACLAVGAWLDSRRPCNPPRPVT